DEPVKAYAIRLQTILDEVDFPASKGVAMFKRGVRHARAESCLEHTDRELNSITDCMKLLRAREVRLDEITAKPQTYANLDPTLRPLRQRRLVQLPVNIQLLRRRLVCHAADLMSSLKTKRR
ncbi:hypothetical protein DYB26_011979, partial [Aphanomyces astaci]